MIAASTSPSGGERADSQVTLTYIMKCLGGGTRIRVDVSACGVKRDPPTAVHSIGLRQCSIMDIFISDLLLHVFSIENKQKVRYLRTFVSIQHWLLLRIKFFGTSLKMCKRDIIANDNSIKNVGLNVSFYPFASLGKD